MRIMKKVTVSLLLLCGTPMRADFFSSLSSFANTYTQMAHKPSPTSSLGSGFLPSVTSGLGSSFLTPHITLLQTFFWTAVFVAAIFSAKQLLLPDKTSNSWKMFGVTVTATSSATQELVPRLMGMSSGVWTTVALTLLAIVLRYMVLPPMVDKVVKDSDRKQKVLNQELSPEDAYAEEQGANTVQGFSNFTSLFTGFMPPALSAATHIVQHMQNSSTSNEQKTLSMLAIVLPMSGSLLTRCGALAELVTTLLGITFNLSISVPGVGALTLLDPTFGNLTFGAGIMMLVYRVVYLGYTYSQKGLEGVVEKMLKYLKPPVPSAARKVAMALVG